ncbi:MAG: acyloxyacyl hydrolase [Anaerolineales bacterium]
MEQGQSNSFLANPKYYTSSKYSAVTLRHKYLEVIQGGWVGETYGRFIGVSGVYQTSGRTFFDGSFGGVYLRDYSGNQLDGDWQYTFSLGIGKKFDDLSVILKFRHFSNGKQSGDNWGQDFMLVHLIYNL